MLRLRFFLPALLALLPPSSLAVAQTSPEDAFIAGYAAAVLQREFGLTPATVTVSNGVVLVDAAALASPGGERLRRILSEIPGVAAVEVRAAIPAEPPPAPAVTAAVEPSATEVLPRGTLFEPLFADPRWPRFSASYRYYFDDPDVRHAGAVSFGETFALYRDRLFGGQWELGFQASVFALFDLDSDSADLINADYWVGIPVSYRYGNFSALARVFHQSSHLGDEYLLRPRTDPDRRVNLSYEGVEGFLSYDIGEEFRIYGGGGYLFNRNPSDLDPWMVQGGVEYQSGTLIAGGALRPIVGVQVQAREESGWDPEWSVRAGFQLENPRVLGRRIRVLGEFYDGQNPNGQFYDRRLQYLGIGVNLQFE